jgi:hypothetical protein
VSILPVETADIPKMRQISMYAVTFDTAIYLDVMPNVNGTDFNPFVTFHADWDPAPYGHVNPTELPDDAPAIGVDNINLPQD